jgi:hypothetical protein
MMITDKTAEYLGAKDLFHVIPSFIFNGMAEEIIAPQFPDFLFLIPIAVADGIVGAFVGLLCTIFLSKLKDIKIYYSVLLGSFILFQYIIFNHIPPFMP